MYITCVQQRLSLIPINDYTIKLLDTANNQLIVEFYWRLASTAK